MCIRGPRTGVSKDENTVVWLELVMDTVSKTGVEINSDQLMSTLTKSTTPR